MAHRLSDVYYTDQTLDGYPEPPAKPIPLNFYQGETITLEVFLNHNGKPVIADDWIFYGALKTNAYAHTPIWEAAYNDGIYKTNVPGFYQIILSADLTTQLKAGTYWFSLLITEKQGTGVKDVSVVILNQPFNINYATISPRPGDFISKHSLERSVPESVEPDKI